MLKCELSLLTVNLMSQAVMGGGQGTSSSVISGAFPRAKVLQRNAFPLFLSLSCSLLLLSALLHLSTFSLLLRSSPLSHPFLLSSGAPLLGYSDFFFIFASQFCLYSSLSLLCSCFHVCSSIDSSSLHTLTDRKTNVRSESLFNLKLCCLALNINPVLVGVCVKIFCCVYVERWIWCLLFKHIIV